MDLKHINSLLPLEAFAESRQGGRSENQDSWEAADTPFGFVVTVCDGMGGGPGGKTASSIAVQTILSTFMGQDVVETVESGEAEPSENGKDSLPSPDSVLSKAVDNANQAIRSACIDNPSLKGMGSTCTILLISESKKAFIAHVGDSRVYQIRGHKKIFRTFDHSMVFDLVKQKVITEEQARLSEQSNIITRALGVSTIAEPDIECVTYKPGDRFLLCTDGIHGTMPERELIRRASEFGPVGKTVDDIATFVDGTGRKNGGGHDNLTLVLVKMNKQSIIKNIYESIFNR